jgi:hypothetical protein
MNYIPAQGDPGSPVRHVQENPAAYLEALTACTEQLARLQTWMASLDNRRAGAHLTYNGGHREESAHAAFHHGMDTVYNILDGHAEQALPGIVAALRASAHLRTDAQLRASVAMLGEGKKE